VVDTKLADTFTYGRNIAHEPRLQTHDALSDFFYGTHILQVFEPTLEMFGLLDFDHV